MKGNDLYFVRPLKTSRQLLRKIGMKNIVHFHKHIERSQDWSTLRIEQSKTRSVLVLPLAPSTVEVLRAYISRCGQASDEAAMFCSAHPPFGPMSACAISVRFKTHARRSDLPIADASAYSLRHSFAMRLLGAGVGMKLIGDLMGHRSLASTSAYLRIQTDMLREVALDVPAEVAP